MNIKLGKIAAFAVAMVCSVSFIVGGMGSSDIGVAHASDDKQKKHEILNVSYDPTREFYEDYNQIFSRYYEGKTGDTVKIKQSHGGSGKQARGVIDGLRADVVTLALAYDIDAIAQRNKLIPKNWQSQFPHNSSPYTSTIVFLVRKGNPKNIQDWDDLIKKDVQVITPNPKTSGGARWNYLAAYGYAMKKYNSDEAKVTEYMKKLFANVPLLDTGARGSTTTFAQRGIGDVLLSWENEAFLAQQELGKNDFQVVFPSISVLAEPPVAVVTGVAKKRGTLEVATDYLQHLYSKEGQMLAGKHFFRPSDPEVAKNFESKFPKLEMMTIEDFGGWQQAQKKHFADGGLFDEVTKR
jgi:sulfate transport system substrate-binding protein